MHIDTADATSPIQRHMTLNVVEWCYLIWKKQEYSSLAERVSTLALIFMEISGQQVLYFLGGF